MNKFFKKALALGLSLTFALAPLSASASNIPGIGRIKDQDTDQFGSGIFYTYLNTQNSSGNQYIHQVDFNYKNSGLKAIPVFGPYMRGGDRLSEEVAKLESQGHEVVAAVNGDSYYPNGIPKGAMIQDGILQTTSGSYHHTLGFTYDRNVVIGRMMAVIEGNIGGRVFPIYQINKDRASHANPVHLLTNRYAPVAGSTTSGVEVVIDMGPGFTGVKLGQAQSGTVVDVISVPDNSGGSQTPIGPNQIILTSSSSSIHFQQLASARVGESVSISSRANGDGINWANVESAIGIYTPLSIKGEVNQQYYPTPHTAPRTALGLQGNQVSLQVSEGRQGHATGLRLGDVVDYYFYKNYKDVYGFDGGGSSTLMIKRTGEDRARIANKLSDGDYRERYNGNGLVFVRVAPATPPPAPEDPSSQGPSKGEIIANIQRIQGSNRFGTAAALASKLPSSDTAIITSASSYPDALVGGPLAKKLNSPILLADKTLSQDTLNSLKSRGVKNIFILGGPSSVAGPVGDQLRDLGYKVSRISGEDRYQTAVKVGETIENKSLVFLASGENYPDALSVGPFAGKNSSPVLLTGKDSLPKEVLQALRAWPTKKVVVAGGPTAISENVIKQIQSLGIKTERVAGANRYETSAKIVGLMKSEKIYLASGENYIDALAAGPLATNQGGGILLVSSKSLGPSGRNLLANKKSTNIFVIGGETTIQPKVIDELGTLLSQ